MIKTIIVSACISACMMIPLGHAQTKTEMSMGNGERNLISLDGLSLVEGASTFSEVRVDAGAVTTFRGTSTALRVPEVTLEQNGWLVLHPVIDGKPDGDIVSAYQYLPAGTHADVDLHFDHPAKADDKFLIMLHRDVDNDRVFDFVFLEDGINVEDRAVFEGMKMIAHIFALPE